MFKESPCSRRNLLSCRRGKRPATHAPIRVLFMEIKSRVWASEVGGILKEKSAKVFQDILFLPFCFTSRTLSIKLKEFDS